MTRAARPRPISFCAENSYVAELERYIKVRICSSRCDSAAEHGHRRCVSSSNLPRSPALSVPGVPASQASSGVDVRPRSTCSLPTRRAGARHAPQKSLCDSCRRAHVAAQAWRPATDTAKPLAVLRAHVWSMVPRRVPWQCMTACRIGVVLCVSVALERGWRGRNVHGDGIPVRPSCLYIISTICNRLDA